MIELFTYLCGVKEIKLFSGMPVKSFSKLYKSFDATKMHYLPALNELIALNYSLGINLGGGKSAVILPSKIISLILPYLYPLINKFKIPLLIITDELIPDLNILQNICITSEDIDTLYSACFEESNVCLMVLN